MAEVRLIDANALHKAVKKWLPQDPCGKEEKEFPFETDICVSMLMEIEKAPTAEAEPVWHGRWEWYEEPITSLCPDPDYGWRCSHCKEDAAAIIQRAFPTSNVEFDNSDVPPKFDYCPNCGAKMGSGGTR